jgi:hypothetical protein
LDLNVSRVEGNFFLLFWTHVCTYLDCPEIVFEIRPPGTHLNG